MLIENKMASQQQIDQNPLYTIILSELKKDKLNNKISDIKDNKRFGPYCNLEIMCPKNKALQFQLGMFIDVNAFENGKYQVHISDKAMLDDYFFMKYASNKEYEGPLKDMSKIYDMMEAAFVKYHIDDKIEADSKEETCIVLEYDDSHDDINQFLQTFKKELLNFIEMADYIINTGTSMLEKCN